MPFRYVPTVAAHSLGRRYGGVQVNVFSTTRTLQDDDFSSKNHYETLNVQPDASPADIKRSALYLLPLVKPSSTLLYCHL